MFSKQFLISDFTSQNHHLPLNTKQPQHQRNPETDTYDRIRIKKRNYKASTLPIDNTTNTNIRRDRNPGSNRYVVFLFPLFFMFSKIKTQAGRSFVGVKSFYYFLSNANKVKAYEFSLRDVQSNSRVTQVTCM